MSHTSSPAKNVPGHVPPELVRAHRIYYSGPSSLDPFETLPPVHEDLPVFWNLYADPLSCPNGAWMVSSYDFQTEIFKDPIRFSSVGRTKISSLIGDSWGLLPLELDPPQHARIRRVVMELLSPARMKAMAGKIRERAIGVVGAMKERGQCEAIEEFGVPFALSILLELFDFPLSHLAQFRGWLDMFLRSDDRNVRGKGIGEIKTYLLDAMADRRRNPGGDFITAIVSAEPDGPPLTDDERLGICFNLFIAGMDTTIATLTFGLRYLAERPEEQERLRNQPELIHTAVEEILRAFSVISVRRIVKEDLDFHGVKMKAGDFITLSTGLADCDPKHWGEGRVDLSRTPNRHLAFGTGIHICVGAALARLEIGIAIEEWLKAVSPFRIADGRKLAFHADGGSPYGLDSLPLQWDAAKPG